MSYVICNGLGESIDRPTSDQMRRFLEALDPHDEEHGAAWLETDREYSLEYSVDGNLGFDCPDRDPRHLCPVTITKVIELWLLLAGNRLPELELEAWLPGTRAPLPDAELQRRTDRIEAVQLALDQAFYDRLGDERDGDPCRSPDCGRGKVRMSAFCRRHHFENVHGRPCPFP